LEQSAGAEETRPNRTDRDVQGLGSGGVRAILDVDQHHDFAILW
jgi:hypothetical protein